jgi:hypothetical protein
VIVPALGAVLIAEVQSCFAPTSAPTTQRCSAGLEGAQRWMPWGSTCIRVAERGSMHECRMPFKLLVRGSRPRRPTKVLFRGVVRDVCSANYPSAPTLTRETTADHMPEGLFLGFCDVRPLAISECPAFPAFEECIQQLGCHSSKEVVVT